MEGREGGREEGREGESEIIIIMHVSSTFPITHVHVYTCTCTCISTF